MPNKRTANADRSGRPSRLFRLGLTALGLALAAIGAGIAVERFREAVPFSSSVTPTKPSRPWLWEVAGRCGIEFRHVSGCRLSWPLVTETDARQDLADPHAPMLYLPESVAGGVGLLDYDRDGNLDVYFVQGGRIGGSREDIPGNVLYRNLGGGRFADVTEQAGVGDIGYGMGCACADFDNDGWTDIYVTNVGSNVLYRNNKDGTFADVSRSAGVDDPAFGASAAFFDYDRDGDLDLFVVNYVVWSMESELFCDTPTDQPGYCIPTHYKAPAPDTLYRNNGDATFTNVSTVSGISESFGNGLGVVPADLDDDGWLDLCVANDVSPNGLWINRHDGTFHDVAMEQGIAYNEEGLVEAGMGIDAQDVEGDLDLDVFMTHFGAETNTLYINETGFFEDRTTQAGLAGSRPFTGFGTALVDLNNDGTLDIYVANGRVGIVQSTYYTQEDPFAEPNLLFEGLLNGTFKEVMPRGGTTKLLVHASRGAAFGDYDNDGDIDIFVVNRDAPAYVLENRIGSENHWIAFKVTDHPGRTAMGARVKISVGGREQIRDVRVAYSYCSSNDPRVYFGLGTSSRVDDVSITWPDGSVQTFGPFAADQIVDLTRSNGAD